MANTNGASQASILVVDDEALVLQTMLIILRQAGYAAEGVSTGKAALKVLDEHEPQVVLIDLHLPDLDGAEVAAHSVKNRPGARTFIMTGDPQAWEDSAGGNGLFAAVEVLAKPVRPDRLLSRIEAALTGSDPS